MRVEVRKLWDVLEENNVVLMSTEYIASVDNLLADDLSRQVHAAVTDKRYARLFSCN